MPVKNIREQKTKLRAKHRKFRESCPENIKKSLDLALAEKFLSLDEYKQCDRLFAFVSSPIEVDTSLIIKRAFEDGKRLAVPKCTDKSGNMEFYYIDSVSELKKGAFGILEPDESVCEKADDLSEGLCIVPGICFDMFGYRIGFGKGYYDRFLERFEGITVGLCYSKCTEHEIPKSSHDKPVDILITEKYISFYQKG